MTTHHEWCDIVTVISAAHEILGSWTRVQLCTFVEECDNDVIQGLSKDAVDGHV